MAKAAADSELPKSKGISMKLVIIVGLLLAIVSAGSGFSVSYFSFLADTKKDTAEEVGKKPEDGKEEDSGHEAPKKESAGHDASAGGENADAHGADELATDAHGEAPAEAKSKDGHADAQAAEGEHGSSGNSVNLDSVVTNISTPSDVWVRLEAVLKPSSPLSKEVTDQIHQDYMAFFRTMRLQDLQGASAFIDMKAELIARANFRAEGKVKSVYIKTFLFE